MAEISWNLSDVIFAPVKYPLVTFVDLKKQMENIALNRDKMKVKSLYADWHFVQLVTRTLKVKKVQNIVSIIVIST